MSLASPRPYLSFPGNAREALTFYQSLFGGELHLFTYAEFQRDDGPADAVAHGELNGVVSIGGSDAAPGEPVLRVEGMLLSLLGTADAATLHRWFDHLAEGGRVVDPLADKPWGAADGQVVDRFGVPWLLGYQPE